MNQVNIIGRLGADPELKYTPSEKAVVRLSVAVNERYGENEKVYWFPVICWNGLAETVNTYLHKGSKIGVTGRLTTRSYETESGSRSITEIIANSMDFLDPKPTNNEPQKTPTQNKEPLMSEETISDDVPF